MDNPKKEIQKKENDNQKQEYDSTEKENDNNETSFLGFGILALPDIPYPARKPGFLSALQDGKELQALEKAQLTLAQSMFHFSPPEKVPQWAKPVQVEEQEKICKEEMQKSQSLYEENIDKSIAEKQANFESVYNKLADKQLTYQQRHSNFAPSHPSFTDEKRKLEEKAQNIQKKFQKLQKMIETFGNLFNQGE